MSRAVAASGGSGALERTRPLLRQLAQKAGLLEASVSVLAKPLTPEEAIGTPGRRDFPIQVGKERVIEAVVDGSRGHAFTDSPREFVGSLAQVLALPFDDNAHRALYVATMNAALRRLAVAHQTVHCKDDDPEVCAREIADQLAAADRAAPRVGLVGLNPAIAERLVHVFGAERIRITDLNPDNIGQRKFGVEVWDGARRLDDLVAHADVVLVTGTTLVNGSFDSIWDTIERRGKRGILFGVTGAGTAALLGLERLCPQGRDG
jgi:uncharacterized protein (DUF4213/DUF364 family)